MFKHKAIIAALIMIFTTATALNPSDMRPSLQLGQQDSPTFFVTDGGFITCTITTEKQKEQVEVINKMLYKQKMTQSCLAFLGFTAGGMLASFSPAAAVIAI